MRDRAVGERALVVGLDNGGTANNATVLTAAGTFLVDKLVENPSRVREGPDVALDQLVEAYGNVLAVTGSDPEVVVAVGLDTPGPASATGVIATDGSTNFSHPGWRGFDFRGALESRLGRPVVYNNDGNAAALYAHHLYFGATAREQSSVAAIVGTGLGGGVIEQGLVVKGAAGMAGEFGHVHIPVHDLLEDDQPVPQCNCGFSGDAESVASLSGIEKNLLPYWLGRHPQHPLSQVPLHEGAKLLRGYAERGDPMAMAIFGQQARAIGMLFTIAANFTDPRAYFVGGGVVEATSEFRGWLLAQVRAATRLRHEQVALARFELVSDLDMAGARGAAIAAAEEFLPLGRFVYDHSSTRAGSTGA